MKAQGRIGMIASAAALLAALLLSSCGSGGILDVLTHDITAPHISIGGLANGETVFASKAITFTVSDSESNLISVRVFGDALEVVSLTPNTTSITQGLSITVSRDTAGPHTLEVQATDAAGNQSNFGLNYTIFSP